jgi:hypothetical protein
VTTPSNAIGNFSIGISSIGDLPTFDINKTLISQYANSPILYQLVQNFFAYWDQTQNIDNFFDFAFNVDSAVGSFLDAIGRLVGVQRILPVTTGKYFGFLEQGNTSLVGNFSNSVFYSGQALTSNYALTDQAFRQLILAKAAFNLTDCSIKAINQLLLSLFPNRGKCYVTDGQNMTMQYVFQFSLTPVEKTIVSNSGVLPRPSGVAVTYSY